MAARRSLMFNCRAFRNIPNQLLFVFVGVVYELSTFSAHLCFMFSPGRITNVTDMSRIEGRKTPTISLLDLEIQCANAFIFPFDYK